MYSPEDLAGRRTRVKQMISERRASRQLSAATQSLDGDASVVCVSDLVRFWDPRTLQVAVEVRAGSDGREFRTRHRPHLTEAISDRRVRGPVLCAPVRCVFTCPRMRNLYCVVDIGALDAGYAAYRASFVGECRRHLTRPGKLGARPLADLVLEYLPLWMPTREPERVAPQLPREFSAEAIAALLARHTGK
jgi:hypothetical protein